MSEKGATPVVRDRLHWADYRRPQAYAPILVVLAELTLASTQASAESITIKGERHFHYW